MTTKDENHAIENAKAWLGSIEEMLEELDKAEQADGQDQVDDARQHIEESVLSVAVRDGWRQPGAASEGAEEYEILLTTGGPALRIYGKINQYDDPETAELQWQDWGTPWTRHNAPEETLLRFARQFYFGA